ncbi:MAG: hypothetical protein AW07_04175 [Candidatus Accumulibacter sp. SK-11]|nr:MAG: hypothetical protein AW07_04175 [Candidatus Accumulibacter sp. SK-11]
MPWRTRLSGRALAADACACSCQPRSLLKLGCQTSGANGSPPSRSPTAARLKRNASSPVPVAARPRGTLTQTLAPSRQPAIAPEGSVAGWSLVSHVLRIGNSQLPKSPSALAW